MTTAVCSCFLLCTAAVATLVMVVVVLPLTTMMMMMVEEIHGKNRHHHHHRHRHHHHHHHRCQWCVVRRCADSTYQSTAFIPTPIACGGAVDGSALIIARRHNHIAIVFPSSHHPYLPYLLRSLVVDVGTATDASCRPYRHLLDEQTNVLQDERVTFYVTVK